PAGYKQVLQETSSRKKGITSEYELPIVRKNGEEKIILITGSQVTSQRGKHLGTYGIFRDVTEQKKTEEALRQSEERYRFLYKMFRMMADNMPDMLWARDLDSCFLFVNQSVCDKLLVASDTDEPIGKNDMYFIKREQEKHSDDSQWHTLGAICANSDAEVIKSRQPQRFIECGNVRGEFLYMDVYKAPIFNEKDEIIGTVGCGRIVTQEKKIEQALRESELRYELATKAGQVGVWDWNLETDEIYIDPHLKAILGYRDEEIRNHIDDWSRKMHPDDVEQILAEASMHFEGLTPFFQIEHRMLHKDGSVCWFLTRGTAMQDADGKSYRMVGTDTDITERKLAEQALLESEASLQEAQRIANIGNWWHDLVTDEAFWSRETYRIFGIEPQEITSTLVSSLIHPDDRDKLQFSIEEAEMKGGKNKREFRAIRPDGEIRHIVDYWVTVSDDSGKPLKRFGTIQDITDRKLAEEVLRESEEYFKALIENSNDVFSILDDKGNITYESPSHEAVLGYKQGELIGRTVFELVHPDDRNRIFQQFEKALKEPRGNVPVNFKFLHQDGAYRYIEGTGKNLLMSPRIKGIVVNYRDVTERKMAEQALLESEASLQEAQRIANIGNWWHDLETGEIYWSEELFRMLGIEPQKVTVELIASSIHPDDRDTLLTAITTKELNKGKNEREFRVIRPDGEIRYIADRWVIHFNDSGKAIKRFGTSQDITERKLFEKALQKSEARLQEAQHIANIGNWEHDLVAHTIYWSTEIFRILGIKPQKVTQKLSNFHTHSDDREMMLKAFEESKKSKRRTEKVFRAIHANGEIRYLLDRWIIILDDSEKPIKRVGTLQDITERILAEKAVRQSEEHFRSLMEQSPIAMQIYNLDGLLLKANKAWGDLWEIKDIDSVVGVYNMLTDKQLIDMGYGEDFERAFSGEHLDIPEIEFDPVFTGFPGRKRIVKVKTYPLKNADGSFDNVVVFNEDITYQKQTEEELQKMEKLRSVGTLAGGIAHDFNNILTGLYGNISLAMEDITEEHSGYKSLHDAEKSMGRAIRLTKQLLTFSKGGAPIKEDVSLAELVKEVAKFDLSGSNVKPVINIADNLWIADVDRGQIQQVFSNLTINANQAMPDGGHLYISLENAEIIENEVPNLSHGRYLKITVRDEGTGIDKKLLERIFDPYFTTKQTGSGLGLATAFAIISSHNGYVGVKSKLGEGATFTLYLPASETQAHSEKKKPVATKIQISEHSARVLVMDDEEMVLKITVKMLEKLGYETETVSGGKDAIKCYQKAMIAGKPFDLIIMDLTIPGGIGGVEAIKEILKIDPNAKAIVSSGYAADPVMANYAEFGFRGIVTKPFIMKELYNVVRQVLENRAGMDLPTA
ncbi:MAG: PAS domain S-box protein, partial [Candidatus Cloacimonetes bacterium]|nr:PAS domain S-box protein [Candidatus Cloacimonadota bacterium]